MKCELKCILFRNIIQLLIFIVLATLISNNILPIPLFKFESPFYDLTPSQLVFLACLVTSTVALTVIGNRFRDRMDIIQKEELDIEVKQINNSLIDDKLIQRFKRINKSYEKCQIGLFQMTIVLSVQVIMTCITCLRILFKWQFIDIYLIWGSVYLFGFLWVRYFFFYGGGEYFYSIFKNDKKEQ